MQEDESIENTIGRPTSDATVARHRRPSRFGGRAPHVAAALVAAVGLSVAGVAAATTGGGRDSSGPSGVTAAEERARADAADRPDRDRRDAPSATPPTAGSATESPAPQDGANPRATERATPQEKTSPEESAKAERATQAEAVEKSADWVHPMPGAAVTSCYGPRGGVLHPGIDLAMPADTPIRAAAAGTVTEAGWAYAGYGISVVVDHGDGYLTHYAHQSRTAVQVGQRVTAGQVIGYEGSTGDSTGPHLHFEVHDGLWNQLDPAPWMRSRGVNLGC